MSHKTPHTLSVTRLCGLHESDRVSDRFFAAERKRNFFLLLVSCVSLNLYHPILSAGNRFIKPLSASASYSFFFLLLFVFAFLFHALYENISLHTRNLICNKITYPYPTWMTVSFILRNRKQRQSREQKQN